MTFLLVILGFAAALAVGVVKALAIDQLRGHIQRRITASVEATIARLPAELQDEWADEWRAELAAVMSMPLTAALYAHGLRHSAIELVADLARAPTRAVARRVLIGIATTAAVAAGVFVTELGPGSRSAAVAMAPLATDCVQDGHVAPDATGRRDLVGQHVSVAGVWTGKEREKFGTVLERFERATGATVTFEYETHDIAPKLSARIKRGCPPDVALLPQPGMMVQLARQHRLQPLDNATARQVRRNYAAFWRRLGTVDGRLYGVWFKAANTSMIWYSPDTFRRAAVRPPRTWRALIATAGALRAQGIAPISLAGGPSDGWTITDWFENVYLRTAGPARYDQLVRHEIRWTDPSVKRALTLLAQIIGKPGLVAGGTTGALDTSYEQSVQQVFGAQRTAAMVHEGDFVASELPSKTRLGRDVDFFDFPSIARQESSAIVSGNVAVRFSRTKAAKRLIQFLATPDAARPWARAGGFISPNLHLDRKAYTDPISRRSAKVLQTATTIRFDLSDQQPATFGATNGRGMLKIFRDFLAHPRDVDRIARQLEKGRAAIARHGPRVNGQSPPRDIWPAPKVHVSGPSRGRATDN
jgi:alpha-glucoside transport system substrate-binding protein